eukprot:1475866-Rhodomonas_salina.1
MPPVRARHVVRARPERGTQYVTHVDRRPAPRLGLFPERGLLQPQRRDRRLRRGHARPEGCRHLVEALQRVLDTGLILLTHEREQRVRELLVEGLRVSAQQKGSLH